MYFCRHFATAAAKFSLGLDHALDTLFVSPYGESCGIKLIFAKDPTAATQTDKISVSVSKKSGKSPPKVEVLATLLIGHQGEQASETKVDIQAQLKDSKQSESKNQQITLKAAVINAPSGESGIACLEIDNRLRASWEDPLAFTGQSEPSINQTISLKIGKFPAGEPNPQSSVQDLACLNNHAEITFTGDAQRSQEQNDESVAAATAPYNLCEADKASKLWPGNFIPPTRACEMVMMEQTSLREANLSLCYKVSEKGLANIERSLILIFQNNMISSQNYS